MATSWTTYIPGENRILGGLSRKDYNRLQPQLERVSLGLKDVLFEANRTITHVYFPLGGVMSLVIETDNGPVIEVGTIGNEGIVGTPAFFGGNGVP